MKKSIIALVVFGCLLAGCHSESRDVKAAIQRYNQLLPECYKNMNMNPMQEVATLQHAEKLYLHMAALGEGRVRMESQLKKIDFNSIQITDNRSATVNDKEVWDFRHVDRETGRVMLEEKNFVYELTYELIRSGDRWLVKKVTGIGDDKPVQNNLTSARQKELRKIMKQRHP